MMQGLSIGTKESTAGNRVRPRGCAGGGKKRNAATGLGVRPLVGWGAGALLPCRPVIGGEGGVSGDVATYRTTTTTTRVTTTTARPCQACRQRSYHRLAVYRNRQP